MIHRILKSFALLNMFVFFVSSVPVACWAVEAERATSDATGSDDEMASRHGAALRDAQARTEESQAPPPLLRGTFNDQPIRAGDKINIAVRGEKDLTGIYVVDMKGDLSFPLVGKIHAEGLRLEEFTSYLTAALKKDFYTNPQVEASFQDESAFNSVSVLGEVMRPGNYQISANDTFLRLITAAGGFNTGTASMRCKIMRSNSDGTRASIPVDVEAVMGGKAPDAELRPGDIIFVPGFSGSPDEKADLSSSIVILGQVMRPGNYKTVDGLTLLRALSQAGGVAQGGDSSQIRLSRKDGDGKTSVRVVDIDAILRGDIEDPPIRSGDTISVPSSPTVKRVEISRSISIFGQVTHQGNYELVNGATLTWLISEAGGFTKEASWKVQITRMGPDGVKRVIEADVHAIIDGRAKDVPLEKRDIVFVPESFF